ncbi:MAG TPA: YbhB/YbcL family Raf kinase inhibitor-like protein [Bryobacteraceae bacterium]|nr:YbhB/YbcL family Raf kinase inhibitor-like protein [Bryobacteraceae bacterium]
MLKRILAVSTILLALALGAALAQEKNKGGGKAPAPPGMALSSPDFQDGGVIPDKFTQVNPTAPSPKLEWTNVPMGTQTFVLIMHDPDAALNKMPEDVLHWMAFNIPGTARGLDGGQPADAQLPDGMVQAKNRGGRVGYMGPGNPAQNPYHHYTLELYALDEKLSLGPDATRDQVIDGMKGHIIGKAVLVGRFHRPPA